MSGARRLIDLERYFVLHAPRQTGKTTTIDRRSNAPELAERSDLGDVEHQGRRISVMRL